MAIAIVGTPQNTQQAGGSSLVCNYPTGHASTNVAYAYCLGHSGESVSGSKTWVTVGSTPANSGYTGYLLRRVLDGTEGVSETFTISVTNIYMVQMRVYSGVNNSTPEDSSGSNPQSAQNFNTSATLAGFTISQSNDEVVAFVTLPAANTTMSTPSGFGNASVNQDATDVQTMGGWDKAVASGAIGTVTSTIGTSAGWFMILVALQPSPTGGYRPPYATKLRKRRVPKPPLAQGHPAQRKLASGFPVVFAPVRRNYPLRTDKPKPPPKPKRLRPLRHLFPYNILLFYFSAIRHVKRRFQPEYLGPKFKKYVRFRPDVFSIGAWLVQLPVVRRRRVGFAKHRPFKFKMGWRRVGTLNVLSSSIFVALINKRKRRVIVARVARARPMRRVSAAAGLLFMAAVLRRRNRPLKLPMTLHAVPRKSRRRYGSIILAVVLAMVPLRYRRRHPTTVYNLKGQPHAKKYRTWRERFVGYVAAAGGTLDAIVTWRKRRGY